jgi:hypothetical protein
MEKSNFESNLREAVSAKIETAKNNAIKESHLFELEDELDQLAKTKSQESHDREYEIEKEIFASSVVSDTVIDFKEILVQIGTMYGQSPDWAINMLAHENSHANIGESIGFDIRGYIVIFSKDESGRIVSIQPAVLSKANDKWSDVEKSMKDAVMQEAPKIYGETMSDGDKDMATRARLKLDLLGRLNPVEVERVRRELGNLWKD